MCGVRPPEHVDHDHVSGAVRGVLCSGCNQGLGNFRDAPGAAERDRLLGGPHVTAHAGLHGRLPAHYTAPGTTSFRDFLGVAAPDLLPTRRSCRPASSTPRTARRSSPSRTRPV